MGKSLERLAAHSIRSHCIPPPSQPALGDASTIDSAKAGGLHSSRSTGTPPSATQEERTSLAQARMALAARLTDPVDTFHGLGAELKWSPIESRLARAFFKGIGCDDNRTL